MTNFQRWYRDRRAKALCLTCNKPADKVHCADCRKARNTVDRAKYREKILKL